MSCTNLCISTLCPKLYFFQAIWTLFKKITLQTPISIYSALIKYLTLLSAAALQIYDQRFFESLLSPTKTAFLPRKKRAQSRPLWSLIFIIPFSTNPLTRAYTAWRNFRWSFPLQKRRICRHPRRSWARDWDRAGRSDNRRRTPSPQRSFPLRDWI